MNKVKILTMYSWKCPRCKRDNESALRGTPRENEEVLCRCRYCRLNAMIKKGTLKPLEIISKGDIAKWRETREREKEDFRKSLPIKKKTPLGQK